MCDHLSDLVFAENMKKKHTAVLRPKPREKESKALGVGMSFPLHFPRCQLM
jgi:hypothetical protein